MKALMFIPILALAACSGAGGELQGNRNGGDTACGGAAANTFGGGFVGLFAPGATGTLEISPTGCKVTVTQPGSAPAATAKPAS